MLWKRIQQGALYNTKKFMFSDYWYFSCTSQQIAEKLANVDKKVAIVCDKLNIMIDDQNKLKEMGLKYRSKRFH